MRAALTASVRIDPVNWSPALMAEQVIVEQRYQGPAIMAEQDSASAFDIDLPAAVSFMPYFRPPVADRQSEAISLTDLLVDIIDPGHSLSHEVGEKIKLAWADRQAYKIRIEQLRTDAMQDGYSLNAASERDFWYFISAVPLIRKGNIVLMDNGNLRAVWKGEHDAHVGLQFLGGGMVQYVIFKRRATAEATSRVAGRDSFEGVKRQIANFDLRPLLSA